MKRGMMVVVGLVLAGALVARAMEPSDKRWDAFTNRLINARSLTQSGDEAKIAEGFALYGALLKQLPEEKKFLFDQIEGQYKALNRFAEAEEIAEARLSVWATGASFADLAALKMRQGVPASDAYYLLAKSHTNLPAVLIRDVIQSIQPGVKRTEIYSLFGLGLDRVAKAAYPNSPALADRYTRQLREGIPMFQPQSIQDAFDLLTMNDPTIPDDAIKKYIMDQSLPLIRRALRSQGKTFVVQTVVEGGKTNAVNPMQPLMDRISAALNAPYYKGLAEELMAMGAVIPNPPDWSAVAASVSAWQDKLMNEGEGLGSPWAGRAKSILGVQGYNDFIYIYNNGTGKPSK